MNTSQNPYAPARAAARRWLERSHSSEYRQKKAANKQLQYKMSALSRAARMSGDYQAIALIEKIKLEMLSRPW